MVDRDDLDCPGKPRERAAQHEHPGLPLRCRNPGVQGRLGIGPDTPSLESPNRFGQPQVCRKAEQDGKERAGGKAE